MLPGLTSCTHAVSQTHPKRNLNNIQTMAKLADMWSSTLSTLTSQLSSTHLNPKKHNLGLVGERWPCQVHRNSDEVVQMLLGLTSCTHAVSQTHPKRNLNNIETMLGNVYTIGIGTTGVKALGNAVQNESIFTKMSQNTWTNISRSVVHMFHVYFVAGNMQVRTCSSCICK